MRVGMRNIRYEDLLSVLQSRNEHHGWLALFSLPTRILGNPDSPSHRIAKRQHVALP